MSRHPKRHPSAQRFHDLLREIADLHDKKQFDYGRDEDPFSNVRSAEEWGVPAWVGCMIRATDKIRRLQTLAKKGVLKNESGKDSLLDLAVYSLIGYVLVEEREKTVVRYQRNKKGRITRMVISHDGSKNRLRRRHARDAGAGR